MNKWLGMNLRIVLISLFLGMLTAFMVWAVQWTLESRQEVTYGLPGKVTVVTMSYAARKVSAAETSATQESLEAYLRKQSLALVYASVGDGRPEMIVYDPQGLLSWFPKAGKGNLQTAKAQYYLFRGTYTAQRWLASGITPLLPKGSVVSGVIDAPPGTDNLQYARTIGQQPLPPGRYTFNATDSSQIHHILYLFRQMGLTPQAKEEIPLFLYFIQNPLVVVTVVFWVMGYTCALLYWILYLHSRAREFIIRRCYGALLSNLVWENWLKSLPGLAAGSLIGVFLSGLLVTAIGQVNWDLSRAPMLMSAFVSIFFVFATWLLTTYGVIKRYGELNLDA